MSDVPERIGRYQVHRLLGEGGMGVLYLATDPVLDRHVALKLLRVDSAELRRRFVREAQSAARIQHPNIVTVYDVGDHDGQLYIAMEYIDGDTLATLIRDAVPFSAIRKLDVVDEIADGLGFAHQRGIVHRDVKPANLMITRSGLVKVLDFGIARITHTQSGEMDRPTLIGTPAYMAPEQLEGAEADARSDIYAVGLVMYELFSGRRAFAGATTADVLELVLAARPTPLEQLVPDIDPELARIVARSMARQPEDRYQDLQAMRKDLARARRRAMQASGDDATIVVGMPLAPKSGTPVAAPANRADLPPTSAPEPSAPLGPAAGESSAGGQTHEDAVIAHLASERARTTRPLPGVELEQTVYAPLGAVAAPEPSSGLATPPPAPPPLPSIAASPVAPVAVTGTPPANTAPGRVADDGPLPVPLPAVPAAVPPVGQRSAGRATVDASPAVDAVRPPAPARSTSPARIPGAAPAALLDASPVAAAAVSPASADGSARTTGHTTAPLPSARKGLPAAVIVGGLVALLGVCFIAAFVVVRALGSFSGPSLISRVEGLFASTASPEAPAPSQGGGASSAAAPPATEPAGRPTAPAAASPAAADGTDVPVQPSASPADSGATAPAPVAPAASPAPPPAPVAAAAPARTPVAAGPVTRPATRPAPGAGVPARDARADTRRATPLPAQPVPSPVVRAEAGREAPREAAVTETPAVPREEPARREPDPPAVLTPREEAIALVRGYVAARNTSHASGIRRVWPTVDDIHLRRVTSAFSAPLTLSTCDVEATDGAHATATCLLTQPGTTGAYAQGQALTIRRTFVFDFARQGRSWVIVGVRE